MKRSPYHIAFALEFERWTARRAASDLIAIGHARPTPERLGEIERAVRIGQTMQGPTVDILHNNCAAFERLGIQPITEAERIWIRVALMERGHLIRRGRWLVPTDEYIEMRAAA